MYEADRLDMRAMGKQRGIRILTITADYNEAMAKDYIEQREGVYYVTGTRVSLDSLVYAFHRGESPETIRQNFDVLQLEEVYGALTYYLAHQSDIDVYIGEQERKCQESRRASEPIPDTLRDKLSRMRQNA